MASNTPPPTGPIAQQPRNQQSEQSSVTPQQPPALPPKKSTRIGFSDKTLWDWLNLFGVFLIPLMIGVFTIVSSIQQSNSSQQRHNTDTAIALDQQRATILQTYISNIQDLLLNHNLLKSKPGDDVATLARAQTLIALQGLDPERKGLLLQFIYNAQLIGFCENCKSDAIRTILQPAIIILNGTNFSGVHLSIDHSATINGNVIGSVPISGADLSGVNLSGADLSMVDLEYTDLSRANLSRATLSRATFANDLSGVDFSGANLSGTYLGGAYLWAARNLTQPQIDQVRSCRGATLPRSLKCHHNQ
jgi:uncharacterized protein YjbI with pentapeptide repeats